MKLEVITPQSPFFHEVVLLGKQHSKTLGMFPEGAYRDHARKNTIFAAIIEGTLAGYILFRVTQSKQIICITHLCIRPEFRKKGLSSFLLNVVKDKYSQLYKGISLSCRKDYAEASKLWEKFGFKAVKTVRSRSIEEKYLIKWWYDFGNPDLFSQHAEAGSKVNALLDSNIIMKLSDANREEGTEALSLIADWLIDEVDYFYAPEVFNEINRDQIRSRAEKTTSYIRSLSEARFSPTERDSYLKSLESLLPGKSVNDQSDRKQLAECIAAGIDHFITLDDALLDASDLIYEHHTIKVLRPADFILFIDQNIKGQDYHSYRLAGARHEYTPIRQEELSQLVESQWLNLQEGEKRHLQLQKLTAVVADIRNCVFRLIKDSTSTCIGYFAVRFEQRHANIKAIRTVPGKISNPLFQQMLKEIIQLSIEKDCDLVVNEETFLSQEKTANLASFGFFFNNEYWYKIIIKGHVEAITTLQNNELIQHFWNVPALLEKVNSLPAKEQASFILQLEKTLWPVRFTDAAVPAYIVPIKANWAGQLFDHFIANSTLFGASPHLCWSKENTYYRSVKPVQEIAPGRILWYVSQDDRDLSGRSKAIVATSYLEEVIVGPAKQLYQRFKNFGIYEWRHIYELAGSRATTEIKALRFADTELFQKPLSLPRISATLTRFGRPPNTFASPLQISPELFNELYRLAKQ